MNLERAALRWLAWEVRCHAVLFERNPRYNGGRPDVLGITRSRHLIEVECKRTISDLKANTEKRHVVNRFMYLEKWPRQFYFLVPSEISERAALIIPEWAGLAKLEDGYKFIIVKKSPINAKATRLTAKECVKLFHLLSNQLVAHTGHHDGFSDFQRGHEDWYQFGEYFYGIEYSI